MENLKCEICNGTEFEKQEGFFICKSCGEKYSVDQVRKMMLDPNNEDDNLEGLEKYLDRGRKARENKDWAKAKKFYLLAEQEDLSSMEIAYYSAFSGAMSTLNDYDMPERKKAFTEFEKRLEVLASLYDMNEKEKSNELVKNMSNDMILMISSGFKGTGNDETETEEMFRSVHLKFIDVLKSICAKEKQIPIYECMREHYRICRMKYSYFPAMEKVWYKAIMDVDSEIKKIDPKYFSKKNGGCYVATCVYGSYDCPQVWTLRRYRDNTLGSTWYGRAFIRTYYAISPTLVRLFGKTEWFKAFWKKRLDKMIARLQLQGVEDTPYNDKSWR